MKRRAIASGIDSVVYKCETEYRRFKAGHVAAAMSLLVLEISCIYKLENATFTHTLRMLARADASEAAKFPLSWEQWRHKLLWECLRHVPGGTSGKNMVSKIPHSAALCR